MQSGAQLHSVSPSPGSSAFGRHVGATKARLYSVGRNSVSTNAIRIWQVEGYIHVRVGRLRDMPYSPGPRLSPLDSDDVSAVNSRSRAGQDVLILQFYTQFVLRDKEWRWGSDDISGCHHFRDRTSEQRLRDR